MRRIRRAAGPEGRQGSEGSTRIRRAATRRSRPTGRTAGESTAKDDKDKDGGGWDQDKREYGSKVSANSALGHGGGIYNAGHLSVHGAEVSHNNTTQDGGGIANQGGTAALSNTKINHNTSLGLGGGVHANQGAVTKIEYSEVTDNASTASTAAGGGLFSISSSLHVRHTAVVRNSAAGPGGGIYNAGGGAVIEESKVSENTTRALGGGIYNVLGTVVLRRTVRRLEPGHRPVVIGRRHRSPSAAASVSPRPGWSATTRWRRPVGSPPPTRR